MHLVILTILTWLKTLERSKAEACRPLIDVRQLYHYLTISLSPCYFLTCFWMLWQKVESMKALLSWQMMHNCSTLYSSSTVWTLDTWGGRLFRVSPRSKVFWPFCQRWSCCHFGMQVQWDIGRSTCTGLQCWLIVWQCILWPSHMHERLTLYIYKWGGKKHAPMTYISTDTCNLGLFWVLLSVLLLWVLTGHWCISDQLRPAIGVPGATCPSLLWPLGFIASMDPKSVSMQLGIS